jgi:hypothetical protein
VSEDLNKYSRTLDSLSLIGSAIAAGNTPSKEDLGSVSRHDGINRQSRQFWSSVSAPLSDTDLVCLIKGIVYAERELSWLGGSVAGAVWLFKELTERSNDLELIDEVSAWVIANTKNPYNPFGTTVSLGARTYSEYKKSSVIRQSAIQEHAEKDAILDAEADAEREALKRLAKSDHEKRDSKERQLLIEWLGRLSIREQLTLIAGDDDHRPNFYPTKIADSATREDIDALPSDDRMALARKLKGKQKGPWGNFKKRLLDSLGEPWNKEPWLM